MKIVTNSTDQAMLILAQSEELIDQLNTFGVDDNLTAAWLSGLGGAASVTLGFYDLQTKQYIWKEYDEPLEILSLTGDMVVVDGQPFWHVHGVFSGRDMQAIGGHVKQLTIGLTGEIHITKHANHLTRMYDESTGLKLIDQA